MWKIRSFELQGLGGPPFSCVSQFFCRFKYVCCTFYLPQIAKDDVIRQSGQRFEWSVDEAKHWSFIVQIMRKRTTNHPSTYKILYYSPQQYQSSKQRMGAGTTSNLFLRRSHHSLIKGQLWIPLIFLILRISWVGGQLPSEAFPPLACYSPTQIWRHWTRHLGKLLPWSEGHDYCCSPINVN